MFPPLPVTSSLDRTGVCSLYLLTRTGARRDRPCVCLGFVSGRAPVLGSAIPPPRPNFSRFFPFNLASRSFCRRPRALSNVFPCRTELVWFVFVHYRGVSSITSLSVPFSWAFLRGTCDQNFSFRRKGACRMVFFIGSGVVTTASAEGGRGCRGMLPPWNFGILGGLTVEFPYPAGKNGSKPSPDRSNLASRFSFLPISRNHTLKYCQILRLAKSIGPPPEATTLLPLFGFTPTIF